MINEDANKNKGSTTDKKWYCPLLYCVVNANKTLE
jgi:hypothetical protein